MKVVHFSITPLAGAPIRLVQALNRLTGVGARLVDLKRFGLYDHDVVFSETPGKAESLAKEADILHLHNYLDCDSTQFAPIDFKHLLTFRQAHCSALSFDAGLDRRGDEHLRRTASGLPPSFISHSPISRTLFYQLPGGAQPYSAFARLVFGARSESATRIRYLFQPDQNRWSFERRWDTKGAPEMTRADSSGCPTHRMHIQNYVRKATGGSTRGKATITYCNRRPGERQLPSHRS